MKRTLFSPAIASVLMLTACANLRMPQSTTSAAAVPTDPKVFNAPSTSEKVAFVPHVEDKPMKSYLAMNLPYAPYKAMYEQLQKAEGIELNNRGEAHITVVTPVEYDKSLKRHLTMEAINKIAEEAKIQDITFTPACIGRAEKKLSGKMEKVYFVVIDSPGLADLRGKIEEAYVKAGGKAQDFVPERFFPHVTLGYTARDLHIEDGITKNKSACLYKFNETK